jgi:hypothetical protein
MFDVIKIPGANLSGSIRYNNDPKMSAEPSNSLPVPSTASWVLPTAPVVRAGDWLDFLYFSIPN